MVFGIYKEEDFRITALNQKKIMLFYKPIRFAGLVAALQTL